ncbi:hypothetical protein B0O99DRAFT_508464 [Bisporella sp. PMI_857]|nr:hypothetical protein B0O99DRAFT_508464 [Bisporella sp. PMI_857]
MNSYVPPLSSHSRDSSSSSFEDSYFYRPYKPLSNLPTPPLTSASTTRQTSPEVLFPGQTIDPQLFGPATHLTNLIPSATSLTPASIPLVQTILARANIPLESIALAVCILDSLDARFASSFRRGCPLTPPPYVSEFSQTQAHIDAIHPEVVILAALILAVKFLDDAQFTTGHYTTEWANNLWTPQQINFAQKVIMENIEYRIMPLWEESIIKYAMRDMELAANDFEPMIYDEDEDWEMVEVPEKLSLKGMSTGQSVLGIGSMLTPIDTPISEDIHKRDLYSSESSSAEPFPMYVEPELQPIS